MALVNISAAVKFACRDTSLSKDSLLKNAFVDIDGAGDAVVIKRPALNTSIALGSSVGRTKGLHFRKNTVGVSAPADYSDEYTGEHTEDINALHGNIKGQFVIGGGVLAYSEKNNINNWQLGDNVENVTSDHIEDIVYEYADDKWVAIANSGNVYTADGSDLSSWSVASVIAGFGRGVAVQPGATEKYCVVGHTGGGLDEDIYTSQDASTWTVRSNPENGNTLYDVAANSTLYCAVGQNGKIVTSSLGTTWTSRTSGTAENLYKVTYSYKTGYWIAVGANGVVLQATDPTGTWTDVSPSGYGTTDFRAVYAIEQNNAGSNQVDFVIGGANETVLYSFDNGDTWTAANFPEYDGLFGNNEIRAIGPLVVDEVKNLTLNEHAAGSYGVVAFSNNGRVVFTSPDGINWYIRDQYNQFHAVVDDQLVMTAPSDTSVKFVESQIDYTNFNMIDSNYQAKVSFDEAYMANNVVLGMVYPGRSGNPGAMVFWSNNSQPLLIHGEGTDADDDLMSYPYNHVYSTSEFLARGIVGLDGYFFIMTNSGNIYHCALNDWRSWPSLNVINAEVSGDRGLAIAKHKYHVVAFGDYSIEFFYNAGNPTGSVLSRRNDIRYTTGLAAPNTLSGLYDVLFFVGQSENDNSRSVYMLDNFKLSKISNYYVDNFIYQYTDWSETNEIEGSVENIFGAAFSKDGHIYYALTCVNSSGEMKTLVYDATAQEWYNWYVQDRAEGTAWWGDNTTNDVFDVIDAAADNTGNTILALSSRDFYYLESDKYQDDGANPIETVIQTSNIDIPNVPTRVRKRWNSLAYVGDQASSSENITIKWTDDDYQNFNSGVTIDISTDFPYFHKLGMARRRAFQVTHSANSRFRMKGLDAELKVMRR